MGVDIELMTDTREFTVKSSGLDVEGQADLYPVILPLWLPFIWGAAVNSETTTAPSRRQKSSVITAS